MYMHITFFMTCPCFWIIRWLDINGYLWNISPVFKVSDDTNDRYAYRCVYDDDNDDGDNTNLHGGVGGPKPEFSLKFQSVRKYIMNIQ